MRVSSNSLLRAAKAECRSSEMTNRKKRYLNCPPPSAPQRRWPTRSAPKRWKTSSSTCPSTPGWGSSRHLRASSARIGMHMLEPTTGTPSLPRDATGSSCGGRTRHFRYTRITCKPIRSSSRAQQPRRSCEVRVWLASTGTRMLKSWLPSKNAYI